MKYYLTLIVQLVACIVFAQSSRQKHPNVILIMADDLAYGDLAFVNGGKTRTPTLDKLAEEGIWFENAYSASAVCAPARASLLTGMYPHETGCVSLNMNKYPELTSIDKSLKTLADFFRDSGYKTGLIGKWHNGNRKEHHPLKRGFQEFEGFLGYMVESYDTFKLDINGDIQDFEGTYLTDELNKRAIDFISRHRDEPFFLHLAHYAPHRPLGAPSELVKSFLELGYNENQSTIYAMIEVMDKGLGDLIGELKKLSISERTLVLFMSDNGPDPLTGIRDNNGLKGTKYTINEGGIHVPFLAFWEGTIESRKEKEVVHFTDVVPTLIDLCDLSVDEKKFSGGSFAGLIHGEYGVNLPNLRFWQWNRGSPNYTHNSALRDGHWKLVRPYVTSAEPMSDSKEKPQLYNLLDDPSEEKDLSDENIKRMLMMNTKLEELSRQLEFKRLLNKLEK